MQPFKTIKIWVHAELRPHILLSACCFKWQRMKSPCLVRTVHMHSCIQMFNKPQAKGQAFIYFLAESTQTVILSAF